MTYLAREIADQKRVDHSLASNSSVFHHIAATPTLMSSAERELGTVSSAPGQSGPSSKEPGLGAGGTPGISSNPSVAGVHVVLPGDRDAQRKRHKSKMQYHEKGAFSVAVLHSGYSIPPCPRGG